MTLAISEINVGDLLLASLYTEAKAKYIVIGKNEQAWSQKAPSSEVIKEGARITYSLYVLWTHVDVTEYHLQHPHRAGGTVTMRHESLVNHYWSFGLDAGAEINK